MRVVEAAQQLVVDRVDLLRLELREDLSKIAVGVALLIGGGLLALLGWAALMIALGLLLTPVIPAWASALVVAGLHLASGAVCMVLARKRFLTHFNTLPVPDPIPPELPRPSDKMVEEAS